jgi:putative ABC transport system substrate-binding protein
VRTSTNTSVRGCRAHDDTIAAINQNPDRFPESRGGAIFAVCIAGAVSLVMDCLKKPALLALAVGAMLFAGDPAQADHHHTAPRVLIVQSENLPQYTLATQAFKTATPQAETVVVRVDDPIDKAREKIRRAAELIAPDAVFALGAQAAVLAKRELPQVPMVFAMVMDWRRHGLDRSGTAGVALEMPVDDLLTRYKLMLPDLNRIGLIYSSAMSDTFIESARAAAQRLNIELAEEPVSAPDQVAGAYRRLRRDIDAVWMIPDPGVVTRDNFAFLAHRTRNDDIAFLAFSENFVRAGALMSVTPSYATMGSQAAALVGRLLRDSQQQLIVQNPLGSRLVVNAATARAVGLSLNATVLAMADAVIDPQESTRGGWR